MSAILRAVCPCGALMVITARSGAALLLECGACRKMEVRRAPGPPRGLKNGVPCDEASGVLG